MHTGFPVLSTVFVGTFMFEISRVVFPNDPRNISPEYSRRLVSISNRESLFSSVCSRVLNVDRFVFEKTRRRVSFGGEFLVNYQNPNTIALP